jgi:hypothetical protein
MKKNIYFIILSFCFSGLNAQNVTNFIDSDFFGLSGLTIDENFIYVISGNGEVLKKEISTIDPTVYDTYDIGGGGYRSICKIDDYIYISKPYNGNYGIKRFNINDENITLENYFSLNGVFGMTKRGSNLFISSEYKIYKIDTNSSNPTLVLVANACGTEGGGTMGLKVYENFLYIMECNGISKINLDLEDYKKETITTYTGNSFAKANNDNTFYLTYLDNNGSDFESVYQLNIDTQEYTLLTKLEGFVGTYDIVFLDNTLLVTTLEGNFDKVAKIDLNTLSVDNFKQNKILIYPNPTSSVLNFINFQFNEKITIINLNGQIVKTVIVKGNKIDVSDLNSGTYFIKINKSYLKFIKI